MSSHSIPLPLPPSFPPLYGARYSETTANTATVTTYGGLVAMEDSHDDDPESILEDHVQRVMKTPGCQSPGATNSTLGGGGRHTPPKSSRSPDGGTGLPNYPAHRGGSHSLPAAGVKGKRRCRMCNKTSTGQVCACSCSPEETSWLFITASSLPPLSDDEAFTIDQFSWELRIFMHFCKAREFLLENSQS